ncbi:DUF4858 domain-containing protein [Bacteroides sp.]|uniref:DUF4858 domain-containing protein n=1 Tax=Bacteroides sp. TaxID=29523 RepID=UPI00261752DD|nr:DUF4858 domain-containing protein [Bacteroides sp.]MDD3037169.1 DUF4858 domain-containing protein [Bacteroides sp.]
MNLRKCKFIILCLLLPAFITAQEWSLTDSLKLKKLLESDKEIIINKNRIEMLEREFHQSRSYFEFDTTLPTLKPSSSNLFRFSTNIKTDFHLSNSTFLPTYSWQKLNKNLYFESKSNFSKTSNYFHIQTIMKYHLSPKWTLNIYGMQYLNNQRYRGFPSEVIPTEFGSNISFKLNKHWKIKTGIQYQHNMILKKWEWIPQCNITYSW